MDADLQSIQEARSTVAAAARAREGLAQLDQARTDAIVAAMAAAASRNAAYLARLAVEETGCGRVESKTQKNRFCAEEHHDYLRDQQTVGIIARDDERRVYEIAEPVGIVAAIIPMTNPTSTVIYKALIALKARNPIVFSPHPRAVGCILETAKILLDAAIGAGAPVGSIGWMGSPTLEGTNELMRHPEVGVILATGGPGLVQAAYSSGKPAFGVGPGNVPVYVDRTADCDAAARRIIASQRFDNSLVCASEQSLIIDEPIHAELIAAFQRHGAHLCSADEARLLGALVSRDGVLNTSIVGQDPDRLARMAGFSVPRDTTLLLAYADGVGPQHPLSLEKLAPILAVYVERDWRAACERCYEVLNYGGMGHTLAIHARDDDVVWEFFRKKPAYRVLVNAPSSQGAVGFATNLAPAMTLGCGSAGNNITSDNITARHLINIKRLAYVRPDFGEPAAAHGAGVDGAESTASKGRHESSVRPLDTAASSPGEGVAGGAVAGKVAGSAAGGEGVAGTGSGRNTAPLQFPDIGAGGKPSAGGY